MKKRQVIKPRSPQNANALSLEIDYDKLAEAIVRAQNASKTEQKKHEKRRTRFRNKLLGFFNRVVYDAITTVCILLVICVWNLYAHENAYSLLQSIIFSLLFVILGVFSFLCSLETQDDDYSISVPLFNLNVSLVAMVVAMISFFT